MRCADKTPISKGIFSLVLITSAAFQLPFFPSFKSWLTNRFILQSGSWSNWQLLSNLLLSQTAILDKNLISGLWFLYNFRIFEKRYGTRKYAVSLKRQLFFHLILILNVDKFFNFFNVEKPM